MGAAGVGFEPEESAPRLMARLGARGLAHNHEPGTAVYTGTHDNDTKAGGWATATDHERYMARGYLPTDGLDMPWTLIRAAVTDCRMNFPGQESGRWR